MIKMTHQAVSCAYLILFLFIVRFSRTFNSVVKYHKVRISSTHFNEAQMIKTVKQMFSMFM